MAVLNELVQSAKRYRHWFARQRQLEVDQAHFAKVEDDMKAQRRRYAVTRRLSLDPSVFLETVIDGNDLMPVRYFEMGRLAARPVGRIHVDLGPRVGQGYATGFLVAPGLLLTNRHVLPSSEVAHEASVTFDAEDGLDGLPKPPQVFRLQPHRVYLEDAGLDFCFVAVSPRSTQGRPITDFGYLRLHAPTGKIVRGEYATIIQHPRGRQKQVAARNNRIQVYVYDRELDKEEAKQNNHLYYETDTLPGSSGAPVFSDQWYVVALHRRGVPETRTEGDEEIVLRRDKAPATVGDTVETISFIANEGVRVSRIFARLTEMLEHKEESAQSAEEVLTSIDRTVSRVDAGPFAVPTAPVNRLSAIRSSADEQGGPLEVVRRKLHVFADADGFQDDFLGVQVRAPQLSAALRKAAAKRLDDPDSHVLPFRHFSTVVHAKRRLPIFAAVNIDGGAINPSKKPARPTWSYDPRLDETHQPDDSIFSSMVQRGHMAAREFMWWGDDDEAREADVHSFTLTNVCPQIDRFNGNLEWYKLERAIVRIAKDKGQRVDCFMGPIFSKNDPFYDDLRSDDSQAELGTGIRMPLRFWYVIAWVEAGKLRHRCFLLDQSDDIDAAGPLEFDFAAPATVKEVSLAEVSKRADLTFPDLE